MKGFEGKIKDRHIKSRLDDIYSPYSPETPGVIFVEKQLTNIIKSIINENYCQCWYWFAFVKKGPSKLNFFHLEEDKILAHPSWKDSVQEVKPGKLLKAILGKDHKNLSGLAKALQDLIKERASLWKKIKVHSEPSDIYTAPFLKKGSLGSSCMNRKHWKFFEFYDSYPHCKIAYLKNSDGKLIGRALLWEEVWKRGNKIKLMDRIYYTNSFVKAAFKRWAKENGYYYKTRQTAEDEMLITSPNGEVLGKKVLYLKDVKKHLAMCEALPFLDTFCCYKNDRLWNTYDIGWETCLDETDGSDSEHLFCTPFGSEMCAHCAEYSVSEDLVRFNDELYHPGCLDQVTAHCRVCGDRFYLGELNVSGVCRFCR